MRPTIQGPILFATVWVPYRNRSAMHNDTASGAAELVSVSLRVNGCEHTLRLDPRVTLLDALRDHLGLTGSRKDCDRGQCGACTALVDGRRIYSCLTLAVAHAGNHVTTIERLSTSTVQPLESAFIEHDTRENGVSTHADVMFTVPLRSDERVGAADSEEPS